MGVAGDARACTYRFCSNPPHFTCSYLSQLLQMITPVVMRIQNLGSGSDRFCVVDE